MSQDDILVRLKKDVRCLLVSAKVGLHPDQLRRDYIEMLGQPLPLKPLGFRDVMDMVNSMPDVVSVHNRPNGQPYLKAVSHDSTKNIEELVARQRISKSDTRAMRGCYNQYNHQYHRGLPTVVLPRRWNAPPALPASLRTQLSILLSQGPLRLSDLESCYLRCFGYPLQVKNYSFYSTGEMLKAAEDLIVIQQSRLGSVLMLREHMMPRQLMRPFIPERRTGLGKSDLVSSDKPASKESGSKVLAPATALAESPVQQTPVSQPGETTLDPVHEESSVSDKSETVEKEHETNPVPSQESQLFQKRVLKLEEELRQQILKNGAAGTVSQELKDKLRKVVGQKTGGLLIHDLPAEYKRLFEEDLPLLENGFRSVTELVDALTDTFHLQPAEDDSGHHWRIVNIQDADNTQSVNSYYLSSRDSLWDGKPEGDDENITADKDKNAETTSFPRPEEKASEIYHLPSILPLDALQNQRLKLLSRYSPRQLVDVLVESVESPGHFHIRFIESQEARTMEDMMFEMRRCYSCPKVSEHYRLPEAFIRRGQVCCVSPKRMWFYRVVIHQIISPSKVEVYYVDFGIITVVPSANLKFLKLCYAVLPAQAVPASLVGIKPTSGGWTVEATASFASLCLDHTIVGLLNGYVGDVLQLYLCDTRTEEDIYIHDVLLRQGHGVACSPAASAAICVQNTPTSLYLGEGMVDLPEIDEELILSFKSADASQQSIVATLKAVEEEMPMLELIEDIEVIPDIPSMDAGPLHFLLNDKEGGTLTSVSFPPSPTSPVSTLDAQSGLSQNQTTQADPEAEEEEMPMLELIEDIEVIPDIPSMDAGPLHFLLNDKEGGTLTSASFPPSPTSPVSTLDAQSGLSQNQTTQADPETQIAAPRPMPPSTDCPAPKEMKHQSEVSVCTSVRTPLFMRTLGLHTSHLGQIQDCTEGAPAYLLNLQNSGHRFPLFGSLRLGLHHLRNNS